MRSGGTFLIFIAIIGLVVGGLVLATPQKNANNNNSNQTQEPASPINDPALINRGDAPRIGSPEAKVQLVVFSDHLCPYCKTLHENLNQILDKYPSDVSLVLRTFIIHPEAEIMAKAAEAANRQGKFKEMNNELFNLQSQTAEPTEDSMVELAKKIGLDAEKFKTDLKSDLIQGLVTKDNTDAQALNLQGTPSVYMNNKSVENIGQIDVLIKEALGQ